MILDHVFARLRVLGDDPWPRGCLQRGLVVKKTPFPLSSAFSDLLVELRLQCSGASGTFLG